MRSSTKHSLIIPLLLAVLLPFGNSLGQQRESKSPNPTGALLRSAFVPGWGQFYNRKYIKGTVIALGESYLIIGIYNDWREANKFERNFKNATDLTIKAREFANFENARDSRNLKMWILATAVFYSMFDAYVDAHLANFDQKDKAYEVFLAPMNDGIQLVLALDIK
ncbi:MAG: hypothetical protein A2W25_08625 [candidate division Zixibacteria bacterium RBG_16_53_22]|nr:MAG: hypothetical protein A2W25_08625 [candidate division Zixibacteria bacterium RBG_16_53_22]